MKTLRLTEVLLPLLAARGWAPWPVDPQRAEKRRTGEQRPAAVGRQERWRDHARRRLPYDDVQ